MSELTFLSDISVTEIQSMGGDWSVAAAAKVSINPGEALELARTEETEGIKGLINYLIKQRHGSCLEHNSITFYVHAPLFVFREWHRHRIASYNEYSGRYSKMLPEFWVPPLGRNLLPVEGYKAARPQFKAATQEQFDWLVDDIKAGAEDDWARYQERLSRGYANEVARVSLGLNIYSKMWVTSNLRAWLNFLSLRTHEPEALFVSYPMAEIEQGARLVEAILTEHFPLSMAAWNAAGRHSI
jgi:thymidylate synthase (FAD)